jgi:hypothetical protein
LRGTPAGAGAVAAVAVAGTTTPGPAGAGGDAIVCVLAVEAAAAPLSQDRLERHEIRDAISGDPTLLVRKGLRPGGLAPAENLTRFTWSLRG